MLKRNVLLSFLASFLLGFMIFIFGPSEIFFANIEQFEFLFNEFIGVMVVIWIVSVLAGTFLLSITPEKIRNFLVVIIFSMAVMGYLQVMFLNKNLDLLGVNPNGYQVEAGRAVSNLVIWGLFFVGSLFLSVFKTKMWEKGVLYLSLFLASIQLVAFFSLVLTAPHQAFERETEDPRLSGRDQYTVSADKNVIVFVLDYFSSLYLQEMLEVYPDGADCLHDFTYYSNADCTYYGTFPSLLHMLTGCEVDTSVGISEWSKNSWENELTVQFYEELREQNYKTNIYTTDDNTITAGYEIENLADAISNVTCEAAEVEINTKLLVNTLTKMSCYRMAPEMLKRLFYTNVTEYSLVVEEVEDGILQTNAHFYDRLREKGLRADAESNYFILQHLIGTHEYENDENGFWAEDVTREQTARGCIAIVEAYLNELKRLGVYDNSTIIITADHGGDDKWDLQVIYYVKTAGETHEVSPVTNAPISHCDFLPTIAQMAGLKYEKYGKSIFDFKQDEKRERTMWVRNYEDYGGPVYLGYPYTGDIIDLINRIDYEPPIVDVMKEKYY